MPLHAAEEHADDRIHRSEEAVSNATRKLIFPASMTEK